MIKTYRDSPGQANEGLLPFGSGTVNLGRGGEIIENLQINNGVQITKKPSKMNEDLASQGQAAAETVTQLVEQSKDSEPFIA